MERTSGSSFLSGKLLMNDQAWCDIENLSLVEWRKDSAGWDPQTPKGWTWPSQGRKPTCPQLTSARSALCDQFLLFSFMSASVALLSELASDSFGQNLLSAPRVIQSLRDFDLVECWRVTVRLRPGSAAFGMTQKPIRVCSSSLELSLKLKADKLYKYSW